MSNDDRRRFFRITDSLGVSYEVMTDTTSASDEGSRDVQNSEQSDSTNVNANVGAVDAYSVIKNHNQIIEEALADVDTRDPQTAKAIAQLNKKVDAILMMLELDNLISQRANHRIEEASISASGIAFPVTENLPVDTELSLDLILKPSKQQVAALGKVVACEPMNDSGEYYLRVEFTRVSHQDKETLIQHIVQRQGELLRTLRDHLEDG